MAHYIIQDTTLTNIADAIREKNGTEDTYKPGDMAAAIEAIEGSSGGSVASYPNLYFRLSGSYQYMSGSAYHVFDTSNATTLTFQYDVSFSNYNFPVSITAEKGGTISGTSNGSFTTNTAANSEKICSNLSSAVSNAEVSIDVTDYDSVRLYVYFNQNSTTYSKASAIIVHDITLS